MKKTFLTSTITAAFTLVAIEATQAASKDMEKCLIIGYDKNGKEKGLIKEGMADCGGGKTSCSGINPAGSKTAWIYLPKGVCEKIEGGAVFKDEKK